jgi:hypothetical protein
MADNPASRSSGWGSFGDEASLSSLSQQIDRLSKYLAGEGTDSRVSRNPADIGRYYIGAGKAAEKETKESLPSFFESYMKRVASGNITPEEARSSFFDLVRSSGGSIKEGLEQADKLGSMPMGMAPAESYERYKPAASLAYEQLLGRSISDPEYQNLVSAAQGLGISKGQDFQDFLGKTIMSSPEYKSKAVVFNPSKVMEGIQAVKTGPTIQEYMAMLS